MRVLSVLENTFHRDFEFILRNDNLHIMSNDWVVKITNNSVELLNGEGRQIATALCESYEDAYALAEYFIRVTEVTPPPLDKPQTV